MTNRGILEVKAGVNIEVTLVVTVWPPDHEATSSCGHTGVIRGAVLVIPWVDLPWPGEAISEIRG